MDAAEFLEIMRAGQEPPPAFRLGTIPAGYVSGRPPIRFDGESAATARTWPYLASYTPAANDRVLVAVVGRAGVVLGKVV